MSKKHIGTKIMKKSILHFLLGIFFIPTVNAHYQEAQEAATASPQSEEAIDAISNFKATPLSSSSIELSWNKNIFETPVYIIERTTIDSDPVLSEVKGQFLSISVTYVDEGLEANQAYGYRIKEESATEFVAETVATTEEEAPVSPSSFVATA